MLGARQCVKCEVPENDVLLMCDSPAGVSGWREGEACTLLEMVEDVTCSVTAESEVKLRQYGGYMVWFP